MKMVSMRPDEISGLFLQTKFMDTNSLTGQTISKKISLTFFVCLLSLVFSLAGQSRAAEVVLLYTGDTQSFLEVCGVSTSARRLARRKQW